MSFFEELKRRNVVRVGVAYVIGGWLLLQLTEVLSELLKLPEEIGPIVVAIVAIGFPIALFFAWAFELTPEGVKREKDVDRSQSLTPQTGKKLNNAIVILLVLGVAYLLFDKFSEPEPDPIPAPANEVAVNSTSGKPDPALDIRPEAAPGIKRQSIAVLPFANRSDQKSDEYFVEGIHDDLLTNLARIGSLKVISRTSVMQYKDTEKTIPVIAKELGVANILEGGIQRSGNQVRINVQLIDAKTDVHLWAEIYDRELTAENLFAIQSEISQAIAAALQATLSPEEKHRINAMPTNNLAAYDTYLRGRQLMATRDSEKLQLATKAFGEAVELDPQFALAWVGVADSHYLLSLYGTLSDDVARPIREDAINHALAIDDTLGEAYASLGSIHRDNARWAEAETAFKASLELSPNYATAYHWYSSYLGRFPLRIDESIELALKAAELDPRSSIIGISLGSAYEDRGLYSMAERQFKKVLDLEPGFVQAHGALASLFAFPLSRYQQALLSAHKAHELDPGNMNNQLTLVDIYLELGDMAAVQSVRERMADLDATHSSVAYVDVLINVTNKNPAGTREAINWLLPKIKNELGFTQWVGMLALTQGDPARSREIYLSANPGWIDPSQWQRLIERYTTDACVMSWLLIKTGDEDLGAELLQQATVFLDETLPAAMEHVDTYYPEACHLTAGDTEKALQSIETQLAHNHLSQWKIIHQLGMFDLIRHEPRYQAALTERERRIAIQREAIKAEGKS